VAAGDLCDVPAKEIEVGGKILLCTYLLQDEAWVYMPITGPAIFPGQFELAQLALDSCKIKDQRPREVRFSGATSFPILEFRMPASGEVTVAIVPIDFPDAKGTVDPMTLIGPELEAIDAWTQFFTGGRLKYNWVFSEQWLTMPKDSKYYVWDKSYIADGKSYKMSEKQLQSNQDQASQLFTEAEKVMDLTEVEYAWIFSTPEATLVDFGPGPTNSATQTIKTATNTYELDYFPIGTHMFGNIPEYSHNRPVWASMLHEMGHAHGLAGHAPGNEWTFDVMTAGGTLNAWNGWLAGWIPDEDFVCLDGTKPQVHKVRLDSVDLNRGGTIAAVVRLSSYEVLVVESRRKGPFSIDFKPGFGAVMAYYIDSRREANRYDGNFDREKDYFSYFVRIDNPDRPWDPSSYEPDPNMLAQIGDSLAFENIRVKLLESTDFDTIEIEVLPN
jgi:hypothetical protein